MESTADSAVVGAVGESEACKVSLDGVCVLARNFDRSGKADDSMGAGETRLWLLLPESMVGVVEGRVRRDVDDLARAATKNCGRNGSGLPEAVEALDCREGVEEASVGGRREAKDGWGAEARIGGVAGAHRNPAAFQAG